MRLREFLLERYYALHEFSTPLQLSASDCESLRIEELLRLAGIPLEDFLRLPLGYVQTAGTPALRAAIAGFYPGCSADDVLVCNAPQEAIFLAMHALLEPGQRVVVQTPCYQSLKEVARALGCEVVEWGLAETEAGWSMDLGRLEELLEHPTRLLITNAPHNPTGFLPSPAEWRRIQELVERQGVRWFADEMYRGLEPEGVPGRAPAAVLVPDAISLWGTSKSFGLPGLRIGWLVSRERGFLRRVEELKDYTTICASTAGEFLAVAALRAAEPILARHRACIAANTGRVRAFLARHSERLSWARPMAGPVGLVRVHGTSAEAYAERLRVEGGVLLVPAGLFDLGDAHVRVGLGRENLPEALERWERAGV